MNGVFSKSMQVRLIACTHCCFKTKCLHGSDISQHKLHFSAFDWLKNGDVLACCDISCFREENTREGIWKLWALFTNEKEYMIYMINHVQKNWCATGDFGDILGTVARLFLLSPTL